MEKRHPVTHKPRDVEKFDPELNPAFATIPVEPEQPNASERVGHVAWEIFKTVAIILLAALFIRSFLVEPFFVDGHSMEPNFHPSDYLLVNQLSYRFGKPKAGDVIVFKAPPEPEENYVKRIIAVPGDTIELKDGRFIVKNAAHPGGTLVNEGYIAPGLDTKPESEQTSWTLTEKEYFVAGDNREPGASSDSRQWGTVPRENIIGKVALRVYPIASFGFTTPAKHPELSLLGGATLPLPGPAS